MRIDVAALGLSPPGAGYARLGADGRGAHTRAHSSHMLGPQSCCTRAQTAASIICGETPCPLPCPLPWLASLTSLQVAHSAFLLTARHCMPRCLRDCVLRCAACEGAATSTAGWHPLDDPGVFQGQAPTRGPENPFAQYLSQLIRTHARTQLAALKGGVTSLSSAPQDASERGPACLVGSELGIPRPAARARRP